VAGRYQHQRVLIRCFGYRSRPDAAARPRTSRCRYLPGYPTSFGVVLHLLIESALAYKGHVGTAIGLWQEVPQPRRDCCHACSMHEALNSARAESTTGQPLGLGVRGKARLECTDSNDGRQTTNS